MRAAGYAEPAGNLALKVFRADGSEENVDVGRRPVLQVAGERMGFSDLGRMLREGLPSRAQGPLVNEWRIRNQPHLFRGARRVAASIAFGVPTVFGALRLRLIKADGRSFDLGLASLRVVTTAGVGFIVDAFQNITELENMKFHALGTGTNAEASSDTSLQTELTTAYNPDNTRATGSTTEAAANIYRTVGTNTVDASAAVTEHGILSQAATGGGVLLDRSVFSVVNLASGDSLQSTYDFTINAGG